MYRETGFHFWHLSENLSTMYGQKDLLRNIEEGGTYSYHIDLQS